jgi:DNA invertase Pin-like site-specific DNA recombinase
MAQKQGLLSKLSPTPAAKYVRMSTEHQQYSIDNQADAISRYARAHNMEIVQTYTDSGKSGLTLQHRPGLRQLIADVEGGSAGYAAILVYDVSRWGRFQDVDESAYYEYQCRRAKIALHYCAETFSNDGSALAALVKTLKRTMAAEYSRELSAKVFAGQSRLTELGFRQGGMAGYGFRRLLLDENGNSKFVLQRGEQKGVATDRVVLIPGPKEEIQVVRRVFRLFTAEKRGPSEIAELLNGSGIPSCEGKRWTRYKIYHMVNNPKYMGANVTNRTSGRLGSRRVNNPPEMWIRKNNAFEAIIDAGLFQKAQEMIAIRAGALSDEEMLDRLRHCRRKHGTLSSKLMRSCLGLPCAQAYATRFGSIMEAYRRIGFLSRKSVAHVERDRLLTPVRRQFVARMVDVLKGYGASVERHRGSALFTINETLNVRLVLTRCISVSGVNRWRLHFPKSLQPDVSIFARLAPGNEEILDYCCVPTRKNQPGRITLSSLTCPPRDMQRFENLGFLLDFADFGRRRRTGLKAAKR